MGRSRLRTSVATIAAFGLLLSACGGDDGGDSDTTTDTTTDDANAEESTGDDGAQEPEAGGDPITVGILTSTSGLLGAYGEAYLEGLEAGLDHATDGTRAVDGRPIELEIVDDGGEPDQAMSAAVDLVGEGVSILAGTASSGIAVQLAPFAEENGILYISGPAATDAVTGAGTHTFRSGRQSYQDVAAAASVVDDIDGANVVAFVQDSEFGAGNVASVEAVLGAEGANVSEVSVPLSANEFTPFVQQVLDEDPDLVFVAWAGDTTPAMWQSMEQQGILGEVPVTTGLGDVATWPLYGPAGPEIAFLSHYFSTAPDNAVNQAMLDSEHVSTPDLFTPDGFVAAQMIVQALTEASPDDVDGMISALEGWTFDGPKGETTVRASDHALLQPMYTASMLNTAEDGEEIEVEVIEELAPDATAPPEAG